MCMLAAIFFPTRKQKLKRGSITWLRSHSWRSTNPALLLLFHVRTGPTLADHWLFGVLTLLNFPRGLGGMHSYHLYFSEGEPKVQCVDLFKVTQGVRWSLRF